jgi:hypothetical protein
VWSSTDPLQSLGASLRRLDTSQFRDAPVEVPFYDRVDSPEAAVEAVRELWVLIIGPPRNH